MSDTLIEPGHTAAFARLQHLLEWLQMERSRLEGELHYVITTGQHADAQLKALLKNFYGLDAAVDAVTVDVEKGVITTPVEAPANAEPEVQP